MKKVNNERGGVFLYVIFIITLLMIFVPVLLQMTSTTSYANKMTENDKRVTDLALSGMESFLAYLKTYNPSGSVTRKAFLSAYGGGSGSVGAGWGAKTFATPEGVSVTFSQKLVKKDTTVEIALPLTTDDDYEVLISATAGGRSKNIRFQVSAKDGSTSVPIDPEHKVAITGNKVLYGGSITMNTSNGSNANFATQNTTIANAVDWYINDTKAKVISQISAFKSSPYAITCTGCSVDQIQTQIDNSSRNPVIIIRPGTLDLANKTTTFGYAPGTSNYPNGKAVILITESLNLNNSGLTVYGNLILNTTNTGIGNPYSQNVSSFAIKQVKDTSGNDVYGNFWSLGDVSLNQGTLNVANQIYMKSFTGINNLTINAKDMTVEGALTLNTSTAMNIVPGEFTAGSVLIPNNATLNITGGDIFVKGNFEARTQAYVNAGGYFAVGGSIVIQNMQNNPGQYIKAGQGGMTALQNGTSTGGGGSTSSDWNPIRKPG
ncbi:hypothetical protein [Paenibacillus thalictri]|uniref:Uncharacterized protein n=1 Tax=Paenibacillus thalictri TaxID=2527873 RepID=A0A4V2J4K4_9BACL|nr:hypothetical protein [Paenibacillus thalictri]TBL80231.1 hypothetical protein EYB31_07380 [Paenibacillus thalictri]